ncbi:baculoviral IAP repeat-containing protein 1 [Discoglossus pictus]
MASLEQPDVAEENEDVMDINEFDNAEMQKKRSFLNINISHVAAERNKEFADIRRQLRKSYKFEMRSESMRLKSFLQYDKLSSWCPKAMASAGFYFTGIARSVQCFCCGLAFCTASLRTPPYEDHVKHNPTCWFIQGKNVGNIPKYDVRVQPSEKTQGGMQGYTSEESRLSSYKDWPFYARIQTAEFARAGFYFTGRRDNVQCFSCAGCLGNWEESDDPWREHAKWFPECQFLASMKTPDEIKQYVSSYNGLSGFTGKHFTRFFNNLNEKNMSTETGPLTMSIFGDEQVRLESFKGWPPNAHAEPAALARCGFYYTGISDAVRCFTCGIHGHSFKPEDDPFFEHLKFSPTCAFLHWQKNVKHAEIQNEHVSDSREHLNTTCDQDFINEYWLQEAANLRRQLMDVYNDPNFNKVSPCGDSSHVSIDLKSLFADISVVVKDTRNQPLQNLTFPDILSDLRDITMIEGEAGSGKTALLKKIAILWASGCCPILSRFSLVIYVSLFSVESQHLLADIICKQLTGHLTSLTDRTLLDIIKQLKKQVLLLVDDYGLVDPVPKAIEDLLLKNHLYKVNLAVTVRTDKGRKLRQYARTILSIQEFPLYSSIYICRQLFSHDLSHTEGFLMELIKSKTFQAALKTPLFIFALCVFWVQNPNEKLASDSSICKAYLMHNMLRHYKETETVNSVVSSCGELAINGLFQSHFDFTDEDLCASGVNSDDALKFGLLSKFTSQRLHPIYRFFHPSFQEFLAGKKISELLGSVDKVLKDKGLSYLQQINTFLKVAGRFQYFLRYACMQSSKVTSTIISYLFALLNNNEALDCQADTKLHLQHHPELGCIEEMLTLLISNQQRTCHSFVIHMLLDFALIAAYSDGYIAECAPIILQFLKGKTITVHMSSQNTILLRFLTEYPEGLSLIGTMTLSIDACKGDSGFDFVYTDDFRSYWEVPSVDQDYSMAFQQVSDALVKLDLENYFLKKIVNLCSINFNNGHHKLAVLKVNVSGIIVGWENAKENLMLFCGFSEHVELDLLKSPGFIESIRPCIEQYKDYFVKCRIHKVELSTEEQELITKMSSLESLEIMNLQSPDHLLLHLDIFTKLKELTLSLPGEVIEMLPGGFRNLCSLEKLDLRNLDLRKNSSRLAEIIEDFHYLTSFHLNCDFCPEFEKIMAALSNNGKILEISLHGLFIGNREIHFLASALPSLQTLKVLDIEGQKFEDVQAAEMFAEALQSLVQLEVLKLPSGRAMKSVAVSFIGQFHHLLHLRDLSFTNDTLTDSSLLELAKAARSKHLKNLQNLKLSVNHDITQSGWRIFFQTLDNLPHLKELCVARLYKYQFKTDSLTFIALVQCVSRLHSLNKLIMKGWLMDAKDMEMFNAMKQKHPQAKSLMLIWQWILPFAPNVQE